MRRLRFDISISLTVQLALSTPTSERGFNTPYPAIHWLNNDILLSVFNSYRLDDEDDWNLRLPMGWCKLSHVCQRWRHLFYACAFHLGMRIKCTNGTPKLETLDHLPSLPLVIDYKHRHPKRGVNLTEKEELGMYHALRLRERVYHIDLELPPSILHKVLVLLDGQFPILERLSLSFSPSSENSIPLALPKAFLAPNLRRLSLPEISPPRRLQVLTSTCSLVQLVLNNIQTSSYFRSRLLVARLSSLPLLEELCIEFSIPIPRPSAESELLGENRAPVMLPSLKKLQFKGVGAYLESLAAQIRAPLLEWLKITLFNQIAFALPHLSYLINATEAFKRKHRCAAIDFSPDGVYLTINQPIPPIYDSPQRGSFSLRVICESLNWKIHSVTQICHEIIPTLCYVEQLLLCYSYYDKIATELRNRAIDSAMWHDLLRSFVEVQSLSMYQLMLEKEISRALRVDEVGSDPGFLPNLQSIHAKRRLFTRFIDTRRVVGRHVEFVKW